MKFNEKLIELRKKQGLSQEELGYKLNVTRQTVSKWELGQTTPEMDKLIEIGKTFNISVDELINETETAANQNTAIEDQTIENEGTKENKVKIIIIIALIVVIALIGVNIFNKGFNIFKGTNASENVIEKTEGIFDRFFNLFDKAIDSQQNMLNQVSENNNKIDIDVEGVISKFEVTKFNNSIELYAGSNKGTFVISVLDNIITSNKTQERKIVVKGNGIETQNEEEIKNIKYTIENFDDYEVTFEYDADGFINKAIIEKI